MAGNVGNRFTALVNVIDWAKRRKISSSGQILTALAIPRTGLLWSVFIRPRDASTEAHITAMQSVIAFVLLSAIFNLLYLMPVLISDLVNDNLILMIY
ncbi:taste receptor type 2 member 14-like [Tupaia chinensis]|uniref:taste receptor type 2 member 14-like n=1 Tax=Tupaia chinensis TaxID=246437 RepID=UPI000FFC343D|nr:taste receptor type 2 member 14-like [Tupaia chinensis]